MTHAPPHVTRPLSDPDPDPDRPRPSPRPCAPLCVFLCVFLCALSLCFGCGGARGGEGDLAECERALKAYPSARFITARGEASAPEQAERAAKAELSSTISAQLNSETKVVVREGGALGDRSHEESTSTVRLTTRFEHAELISVVEGCTRCGEGAGGGEVCSAHAWLNRDEAAHRVISALGPDAQRLSASLRDLTPTQDLLKFTQAWHAAQGAYERLTPALNQLKVIGRMPSELQGVEGELRRAQEVRAARERRIWVWARPLEVVDASGQPAPSGSREALEGAVGGALSRAVEAMGLKVWGGSACPEEAQGAEVIVVAPRGALRCTLGLVGPQCTLGLSAALSRCPDLRLGEVDWSSLKLAGAHTQEESAALSRLSRAAAEADLRRLLAAALSPFLIL
jgi:hypothetical protein